LQSATGPHQTVIDDDRIIAIQSIHQNSILSHVAAILVQDVRWDIQLQVLREIYAKMIKICIQAPIIENLGLGGDFFQKQQSTHDFRGNRRRRLL
jgi:hypothetical protein